MVIHYCRLSSVYGEIFSCTNMPTEVSTPEWLHRWEAQIATQQHPIRRLHVAPQDTSNNPHHHTHTRKRRRSRLGSITVFTWARLPSKKVLFYRNQGGCRCFQRWLYSPHTYKSLHFSPVSLPGLCGTDLSFWKPCLVRYWIRFTCDTQSPDNSSACSFHPPPQKRVCSSSWRSSLGCLRPLTVFYFQRLILRGGKSSLLL